MPILADYQVLAISYWVLANSQPAIPNSDFDHGVLGISDWVLAVSKQLIANK